MRNYLRSARGPQDAERAYALVAGQCERDLAALHAGPVPAFAPWKQVMSRAQADPDAVQRVQAFAAELRDGRSLEPAEPEHAAATAVAMTYGFSVRALDLSPAVASLAAGWCWLQWCEAQQA